MVFLWSYITKDILVLHLFSENYAMRLERPPYLVFSSLSVPNGFLIDDFLNLYCLKGWLFTFHIIQR